MKILIPTDGSISSLDAVRHALRLRREGLQTRFVLATVQETTFVYEVVLAADASSLERLSGAAGARLLKEAEALFNDAGVPFEREIGSGAVAPTLIEIAARYGCDAIVMGARGWGALRGALLGSVSHAVLQASSLPITIVKHVALA